MSKRNFDPIIPMGDDGLFIPEVGPWSEIKYKLLGGYCDIFTTGMKNLWDELVYIDLFAGAGFARIKNTSKIRMSSPLISLSVNHKFSKYIFCEQDEKCFNALTLRVGRLFPEANVEFILGDSNEKIEEIIKKIPAHSKNEKVLRFCFVDPFSLNLRFSTIEKLSKVGKIDFLILLALHMDGNRNLFNYISENSTKVDEFLGDSGWREPFRKGLISSRDFIKYLAEKYDQNMQKLTYKEPVRKHLVKIDDINVPLYYLGFYSKHERGNDFYKKVEKYLSSQQSMF
jgi:three-Cys-motif partner protein